MMWDTKWDKQKSTEFKGTALAPRCYESHPVLKFGKGRLYGGSASYPVIKNADAYVALQSGSTCGLSSDPWEKKAGVVEVHYTITDMAVPKDVPRFKKMVTWLCNQLQDGQTVHVGCVGGHGRTGMVLSAVVAELLKKEDAIQWVRKNYCQKAVESKSQIQFLMKHYGVTEAEASKGEYKERDWSSTSPVINRKNHRVGGFFNNDEPKEKVEHWQNQPSAKVVPLVIEGVLPSSKSFNPMASARSLWKQKKRKH